jgi:hypothetical protein
MTYSGATDDPISMLAFIGTEVLPDGDEVMLPGSTLLSVGLAICVAIVPPAAIVEPATE